MQFKSSEFSLQDFLLLQPKQRGEFIIDQAFSFDNTSLHTNDTLSHSEETWSLSSLAVKKLRKQKKGIVDPKNVTLKEMVIKRQRTQGTKKGEKSLEKSKKIRKDSEERNVTSASFAKRQHTQKWNVEETKKFYKVRLFKNLLIKGILKGLEFFGTDFSMIAKLFGTRNRLQIKVILKFRNFDLLS